MQFHIRCTEEYVMVCVLAQPTLPLPDAEAKVIYLSHNNKDITIKKKLSREFDYYWVDQEGLFWLILKIKPEDLPDDDFRTFMKLCKYYSTQKFITGICKKDWLVRKLPPFIKSPI